MVIATNQLSDGLFNKFSSLVYDHTGIFLKPEKKELLNARLGKRLRKCKIASFEEYFNFVQNDSSGHELIQLIDSVSTNFTSFFRENVHFDYLAGTILPAFVKDGGSECKLWSAACSSGEEPYTLAIVLREFQAAHAGFRFAITATDISTKVLALAKRGVYGMDRMRTVPPDLLRRYFRKGKGQGEGFVKVKPELQQAITFKRFNLMGQFPWQNELDVIFCRNVMIYFNRETQKQLVEKFYRCLKPGGHLLIGHSESLTNINTKFRQVATTTYRK